MSIHQAGRNSILNIHLFSFWPHILVASSFHCQRFRGQEGITAKRKRNHCQRRLSSSAVLKVHEIAQNFFRKRTDRRPVRSHKIRKPSKAHILLRLLFTRESFATVLSLSFLRPSMRRLRSSASWQRARRPARRPCVEAPWPRSPS